MRQTNWRTKLGFGVLAVYRLILDSVENVLTVLDDPLVGVIASLVFTSPVTWGLFLIAIFVATAEVATFSEDDRATRVVVAISATGYAVVWHAMYFRLTGPIPPTVETSAVRMAGVTILTAILLFVGEPADVDASRIGTLTAGCFALGLVGGILSGLSPLPELLILGWIVLTGAEQYSASGKRSNSSVESVDLEDRLLHGVVDAARNEKGQYALIVTLTELATSLLFLLVFLGMFYIDYGGGRPSMGWGPFIAVAIPFSMYAMYGTWFWSRVLQRIPLFVSNDRHRDESESPTRPIGLFLPPSIFAAGLFLLGEPSRFAIGVLSLLIGTVGMLASVVSTRRKEPQLPSSDQYAIPVAIVVQFLPLALLGFPNSDVPLLILPAVFFLPEIRRETSSTVTLLITILIAALFVVLVWPPTIGRLLALTVLPAEIVVIAAIVQSVTDFQTNTLIRERT